MSTTESAPTGSQPTAPPPTAKPPRPSGSAGPTSGPVPPATAERPRPAFDAEGLNKADQERRRRLNRMKAIATGALVLMAIIFVIAFSLEDQYPWLGYVRAMAE